MQTCKAILLSVLIIGLPLLVGGGVVYYAMSSSTPGIIRAGLVIAEVSLTVWGIVVIRENKKFI